MNTAALESDLRALGLTCAVEARDRLAILVPLGDASRFADAEVRREAVRLAQEHGFTHLALELGAGGRGDAPAGRTSADA